MKVALILEGKDDGIPAANRIRMALKTLLRRYRLVNRLFIDPATLYANRSEWCEVKSIPPDRDYDCSKTEPEF